MEKDRIRPVKSGKGIRMSYARQRDVLEMPYLIEAQRNSYQWFLDEGLMEVFKEVSPIEDYNQNLSLEFVDYRLCVEDKKYTIAECKERDATYSAPLRMTVRLHTKDTGEFTEHEIFMGDMPLMTETGTFVINGAERVIVSQLVRSPGIYYSCSRDKVGTELYSCQVIPNRGAWLEYETDMNNVFWVHVDRTRKFPITALIRMLGVEKNEDILNLFGEEPKLIATFEKDVSDSYQTGLFELYKRIRPGEPLSVESAESHIMPMFFDTGRYDLARVGRYKYNKKLSYRYRLKNQVLAEDVIDPTTGEVMAEAGTKITEQLAIEIQNAAVSSVTLAVEERNIKVLSNLMVDINTYVDFDCKPLGIKENVYYPVLAEILESADDEESLKEEIRKRAAELVPKHITREDILATISYCLNLEYGVGSIDDIDHLGNRRIRAVGELVQNQFRVGLARMEKQVKERMATLDSETISPQTLINIKPLTSCVKEFFGSSQLSQFMDQNNPLGELTHKRRLSALGPGGLSRDRAGFEVRDVHYSHYGRMCPIETPEGPNIGLINSFATYARLNEYGFIEAPYRKVDKTDPDNPIVTDEVIYLTADEEDNFTVAQASEPLDEQGHFLNDKISGRCRDEISQYSKQRIDLMDVSPKMVFSVATSMIPFLQNDDSNRALMGSNMQRQAVPLMTTETPIVGTGMEEKVAVDSGVCVIAKKAGVVVRSTSNEIVIKNDDDGENEIYRLTKFARSNQSNCYNQKTIVDKGDHVEAGEVIADGASTAGGEIALGKNPLIGFMTWEGYNYEDAVLLSERLVRDDVYTSIHIEEHECQARDTKLGAEEITRDVPSAGEDALRDLDENGIIRVGAEVRSGDYLVGKVTPKGETELTAEEKLLRAIFGEKAREVRDTSLKVPHGESGIVVDTKVFKREYGDDLPPGVNESVRIYIAQKRKISVGDKMAGRHGNKGVVSRILPVEDMPFLPNGRPLDIVLNPLGVPSRMNIGQVLEIHLSLAAKALGFNISTPVFNGANEEDIMDTLEMANDYVNSEWEEFEAKYKDILDESIMEYLHENLDHRSEWKGVPISRDGKVRLRDGRTGEYFDSPVTVGHMHYLKLHHLVDDKIHARSTGPYSLVTQQPLGGKAQFGGQRFGEMEVWALEAYGAAFTLQEILTYKSDDVVGRVKTYEAIIKGENIKKPGIPESFKVLIKELQSLALDVRLYDADDNEVELKESTEYDSTNFNSVINRADNDSRDKKEELERAGYGVVRIDEESGEFVADQDESGEARGDQDESDDYINADDDYDAGDEFDSEDEYGDGNVEE